MSLGDYWNGGRGPTWANAGACRHGAWTFISILVPEGECCVESLGQVFRGDLSDTKLLHEFAHGVDVFTFEWENVPQATLESLANMAPMRPSPQCARVAKDRIQEKKFFQSAGLNVQKFAPVLCEADLASALEHVGVPSMLKLSGRAMTEKDSVASMMPRALWMRSINWEKFPAFLRRLWSLILKSV